MSTHFFGIKDRFFSYSHSVGRSEFAGPGFRDPLDLALAHNDRVYVVNRSFEVRRDGIRITVCTLNEDYICEFGGYGEGDGQFVWPSSIALDKQGNVYVSDEWLNRISVFDKDGEFLGQWGQAGDGDGELHRPSGLAILHDTLFVADTRNHRIQAFTLDGNYRSQFGHFGSGKGQLNMPWGLGLDTDEHLYVADWRNDRVQKFTPDGQWVASFGESGSGEGQFKRPSGVGVDQDGDIYVADWANARVQVFAPDGRFITSFMGDHQLSRWGKERLMSNADMIRQRALAIAHDRGAFEKSFAHPVAVKVDAQYRIAVLDSRRGRIQVYVKSYNPVL